MTGMAGSIRNYIFCRLNTFSVSRILASRGYLKTLRRSTGRKPEGGEGGGMEKRSGEVGAAPKAVILRALTYEY